VIKEIIVVEGLHDQQKLQSIDPSIDCITTNGTALSEATLALIQKAQDTRGVILLLDPDHPGRTITNAIVTKIKASQMISRLINI
jgi:ribonuclease M5